jgi:hypothetical protein
MQKPVHIAALVWLTASAIWAATLSHHQVHEKCAHEWERGLTDKKQAVKMALEEQAPFMGKYFITNQYFKPY